MTGVAMRLTVAGAYTFLAVCANTAPANKSGTATKADGGGAEELAIVEGALRGGRQRQPQAAEQHETGDQSRHLAILLASPMKSCPPAARQALAPPRRIPPEPRLPAGIVPI